MPLEVAIAKKNLFTLAYMFAKTELALQRFQQYTVDVAVDNP